MVEELPPTMTNSPQEASGDKPVEKRPQSPSSSRAGKRIRREVQEREIIHPPFPRRSSLTPRDRDLIVNPGDSTRQGWRLDNLDFIKAKTTGSCESVVMRPSFLEEFEREGNLIMKCPK